MEKVTNSEWSPKHRKGDCFGVLYSLEKLVQSYSSCNTRKPILNLSAFSPIQKGRGLRR